MRQARHDQRLRRYHDRNVKETSFNVGNLVLRCIRPTTCTSSPPPGKDPSSPSKSSTHPHIAFNGVTGKEYQTLGTLSIYDDSIRRIVFYSYVFPFLVPFFRLISIS
jgi:hypothetical protein